MIQIQEDGKMGGYFYRINETRKNSEQLGNCEVCEKYCDAVYIQSESKEFKYGRFAHLHTLFGHKECLFTRRKKDLSNRVPKWALREVKKL